MANATGYITVYESSDGGTGDPRKTIWQFFVGAQPVTTTNDEIAKTARLAISTASMVQVTYDPANGNAASQVRMEFAYACSSEPIRDCDHPPFHPEPGTKYVCETKRYAPCDKKPSQ